MDWFIYPLIVAVGVVVGFINTVAGSGSLLSLPLLIFLGLDAPVANGTNRIGILLQSATAVFSYRKHKVFAWNDNFWFIVYPAIAGALLGAFSASIVRSEIMELFIAGLLVFMLIILLISPKRWLRDQHDKTGESINMLVLLFNSFLYKAEYQQKLNEFSKKRVFWLLARFFVNIIIFFAIGLYGGFIQAGVGFFLLSGLVLSAGYNLVKANAIKLLIILFYTPFTIIIFAINNQIDYKLGLILGIGNVIGAYFAARMSVKKGNKFVRYFLIVAVVIAAVKLLIDNL